MFAIHFDLQINIKNLISTKTADKLNFDVHTTTQTAKEFGFTELFLLNGFSATYKLEDTIFDKTTSKVATVTLHYSDENMGTITFNLAP